MQVAKSSQFSLESERAERVKNARKSNSGVATVSLRFRNQVGQGYGWGWGWGDDGYAFHGSV